LTPKGRALLVSRIFDEGWSAGVGPTSTSIFQDTFWQILGCTPRELRKPQGPSDATASVPK
jgi:hypothetical protein